MNEYSLFEYEFPNIWFYVKNYQMLHKSQWRGGIFQKSYIKIFINPVFIVFHLNFHLFYCSKWWYFSWCIFILYKNHENYLRIFEYIFKIWTLNWTNMEYSNTQKTIIHWELYRSPHSPCSYISSSITLSVLVERFSPEIELSIKSGAGFHFINYIGYSI